MNTHKITAEIKKINQFLGENNGASLPRKLTIPDYQRPYRWKEENVRLLLQDIFSSWKAGKKSYRIGSVILHEELNKANFNIVDGQQRITTVLLTLKALNNEIGKLLRSSLNYRHADSSININRNFNFIARWIEENLGNEKEEFCRYLVEYCEFVEIVVSDLSEAFQMFDSQNGRGKELESYSLLKAYHIRAMDVETQETKIECDRRWEIATRYAKDKSDPKENVFDILKQVFNEQLYRTRIWSRRDVAFDFNKQKIGEFKGISIDRQHLINHPFQNTQLLQYIASNYFTSIGLKINGIKDRFNEKDPENMNPFVLVNQNIVNGKPFFDYIETYVEVYKHLFLESKQSEFVTFFIKYCFYPGSHRDGDRYLRELYKSLIFLVFDKFGEDGISKYYRTLYILVYRIRLKKIQVRYDAVAKYPQEEKLFFIIESAKSYLDLQELDKKAKEKIDCKKEVKEIIKFFIDSGVTIETTDSNINLKSYQNKLGHANN